MMTREGKAGPLLSGAGRAHCASLVYGQLHFLYACRLVPAQ